MLDVLPLSKNFEVVVNCSSVKIPSAQLKQIEDIWSAEKLLKPHLYNDKVFCADSWSERHIGGHFVDYSWFAAQHINERMYDDLRITLCAVSGIVHTTDGVLFGQRSNDVRQGAGFWELAPSGSLDANTCLVHNKLIPRRQVLCELEEETGIPNNAVDKICPIALIHDEDGHVLDIAFRLDVSMNHSEVEKVFSSMTAPEYTSLRAVPYGDIPQFFKEQGDRILPVSKALLEMDYQYCD